MATCRFLQNPTFASLVAPVTEEEFQTQYWEEKPLIVHRNDPDHYCDFFTVGDLDKAITSSPEYKD
jgi:ribosomal protein L16 Arg81 hydroxylase